MVKVYPMSTPRATSPIIAPDRVGVLLPLPLGRTYDYLAPGGTALSPGDFVEVPLGARQAVGVVWGAASGDVAATKLKEVSARLEAPSMPSVSRRFVEWVAAYTVQAPGAVLKMAMSVPQALYPPKDVRAYALASGGGESA